MVDGSTVRYMRWEAGEPDFSNIYASCVELRQDSGYIGRMEECSDDNHLLCQLGTCTHVADMHPA